MLIVKLSPLTTLGGKNSSQEVRFFRSVVKDAR